MANNYHILNFTIKYLRITQYLVLIVFFVDDFLK